MIKIHFIFEILFIAKKIIVCHWTCHVAFHRTDDNFFSQKTVASVPIVGGFSLNNIKYAIKSASIEVGSVHIVYNLLNRRIKMSLQRPCERRSVQLNPSHSGPTDPCPSWEIYSQAWCHDARVQFSFALTSWATTSMRWTIWRPGTLSPRSQGCTERPSGARVSTAKIGAWLERMACMYRKRLQVVLPLDPKSVTVHSIRKHFLKPHISMTCYPRNVLVFCSSGSTTSTTTTIHLHCRTTAEDVQYFFPISRRRSRNSNPSMVTPHVKNMSHLHVRKRSVHAVKRFCASD